MEENTDFFSRMYMSLYDNQFKASRYRKGLTYLKNGNPQIKYIQQIDKNQKEENINIIQKKIIKPQKKKKIKRKGQK